MNTGSCRFWIFWAFSPAGWNVSCGAFLAQPPSSAAAATTARPTTDRCFTFRTVLTGWSTPLISQGTLISISAPSTPGTVNEYGCELAIDGFGKMNDRN